MRRRDGLRSGGREEAESSIISIAYFHLAKSCLVAYAFKVKHAFDGCCCCRKYSTNEKTEQETEQSTGEVVRMVHLVLSFFLGQLKVEPAIFFRPSVIPISATRISPNC